MLRLGCALAAMIVGIVAPALAESISIPASRDNTLFQDANGALSDGAGPVLFAGNNGQSLARRALLKFDLGSQIPAGAAIDSVVLTIQVSNASNSIPQQFALHRVLRDWGEGTSTTTSGSGAPATAGDATWLHTFYPDQFWINAGGDFDASVSDSITIGGLGSYSWRRTGMAADVEAWLLQPGENFGWLIEGDETTANTARRFESRESAVPASRPTLTIYYSQTTAVDDAASPQLARAFPSYPNPSCNGVRIRFELANQCDARLIVADAVGRRVCSLRVGTLAPGHHEIFWDERDATGSLVPPGAYFYRLSIKDQVMLARPLVIVR